MAITEIEKALIGSILLKPDNLVHLIDIVKPEDFSSPEARQSMMCCVSLWSQKKTVDLVSVASECPEIAFFLAQSTEDALPKGATDYAKKVAESAMQRRISETLATVLESKESPQNRLQSVLELYQTEMYLDAKSPDMESVFDRFEEYVDKNRKSGGLGISTGFDFMADSYIQYEPGHIWVMGAYTSVGKTAMMIQMICKQVIKENCPNIVIVSTEMTEQQMVARILANLSGIHSFRILSGNYRNGEEEHISQWSRFLRSKPIQIYDDVYEVGKIETVFRRADLQAGVNIGFIDYVQNCQLPGTYSDRQEGSTMAKRFQKMAKDVSCTLICLSQVSNDVGRGNTEQLEYKGAGEWAAVADVGVHLQRHKTDKHLLKYQIKKNRHGRLAETIFQYNSEYTKLKEAGG